MLRCRVGLGFCPFQRVHGPLVHIGLEIAQILDLVALQHGFQGNTGPLQLCLEAPHLRITQTGLPHV